MPGCDCRKTDGSVCVEPRWFRFVIASDCQSREECEIASSALDFAETFRDLRKRSFCLCKSHALEFMATNPDWNRVYIGCELYGPIATSNVWFASMDGMDAFRQAPRSKFDTWLWDDDYSRADLTVRTTRKWLDRYKDLDKVRKIKECVTSLHSADGADRLCQLAEELGVRAEGATIAVPHDNARRIALVYYTTTGYEPLKTTDPWGLYMIMANHFGPTPEVTDADRSYVADQMHTLMTVLMGNRLIRARAVGVTTTEMQQINAKLRDNDAIKHMATNQFIGVFKGVWDELQKGTVSGEVVKDGMAKMLKMLNGTFEGGKPTEVSKAGLFKTLLGTLNAYFRAMMHDGSELKWWHCPVVYNLAPDGESETFEDLENRFDLSAEVRQFIRLSRMSTFPTTIVRTNSIKDDVKRTRFHEWFETMVERVKPVPSAEIPDSAFVDDSDDDDYEGDGYGSDGEAAVADSVDGDDESVGLTLGQRRMILARMLDADNADDALARFGFTVDADTHGRALDAAAAADEGTVHLADVVAAEDAVKNAGVAEFRKWHKTLKELEVSASMYEVVNRPDTTKLSATDYFLLRNVFRQYAELGMHAASILTMLTIASQPLIVNYIDEAGHDIVPSTTSGPPDVALMFSNIARDASTPAASAAASAPAPKSGIQKLGDILTSSTDVVKMRKFGLLFNAVFGVVSSNVPSFDPIETTIQILRGTSDDGRTTTWSEILDSLTPQIAQRDIVASIDPPSEITAMRVPLMATSSYLIQGEITYAFGVSLKVKEWLKNRQYEDYPGGPETLDLFPPVVDSLVCMIQRPIGNPAAWTSEVRRKFDALTTFESGRIDAYFASSDVTMLVLLRARLLMRRLVTLYTFDAGFGELVRRVCLKLAVDATDSDKVLVREPELIRRAFMGWLAQQESASGFVM